MTLSVAEIRRCAAQGLTSAEAARQLGEDPYAVRRYAKRFDIQFSDSGRGRGGSNRTVWTDAECLDILARDDAGQSNAVIGQAYGVGRGAIAGLLSRLRADDDEGDA